MEHQSLFVGGGRRARQLTERRRNYTGERLQVKKPVAAYGSEFFGINLLCERSSKEKGRLIYGSQRHMAATAAVPNFPGQRRRKADPLFGYARLVVQCSCPAASGHAEPSLSSVSQVFASLPPSTR